MNGLLHANVVVPNVAEVAADPHDRLLLSGLLWVLLAPVASNAFFGMDLAQG